MRHEATVDCKWIVIPVTLVLISSHKNSYTTELTSFESIGWHTFITDTGVLLTVSHSILVFYHSDTLATSCSWSQVNLFIISDIVISCSWLQKIYHNAALLLQSLKQLLWTFKVPKTSTLWNFAIRITCS